MEQTITIKRRRELLDRKPSFELETQQIVLALSQSVTAEQRRIGLKYMFSYLSYDSENRVFAGSHDLLENLVEAGAVDALCLQLGYVVNRMKSEEEMRSLCQAVDLLHRCSRSTRESSLQKVGSDLLSLLLRAASRYQKQTTIREIFIIWHTFSGSSLGAIMLLKFPGLLDSLVNVLHRTTDGETETKNEALAVIKNLSHYAEDYRLNILQHPGMLSSLSKSAFGSTSLNKKLTVRLSAVLRNLAGAPNTRIVIAQHHDALNALIALSSSSHPRTTRNTLSTILSLAMDTDTCILLIMHGDGILLSVLARLVQGDKDVVVRRRAARALRLLARNKGVTHIFHETSLIDALGQSAMHDESQDVRVEAAEAFVCCTSSVQAQMPYHRRVLEILMSLATRQSVVPDIVAKALQEKAGYPSNRVSMANHVGLLSALSAVAVNQGSSTNAKEYAVCALMHLSTEESNREAMATKAVLVALVKSALDTRDESSLLRLHATRAMVNLASLASNRKRMVSHSGLLNALVHCAAASPDAKTKGAVKEIIMLLVPVL